MTEMMTENRHLFRSLVFLVFLAVATRVYSAEDARQLYEKAAQLEEQLRGSESRKSQPAEWKKAVDAYRRVYYAYPSSGYCDNALFHVGGLYGEMGDRFHDPLYYRRAVSSYQFLIEQYGSSSLVQDSMLEFIRISRNEINEENEAAEMEAQLRKKFPKAALRLVPPPSRETEKAAPKGSMAELQALRHYTGPDYTRIVLDFDKEVSFRRNRLSDPDRLYFDFDGTAASKELLKQNFPVDDGLIQQIRVGQNQERTARVVIDLKSIQSYEAFALYHPYRVVIDIQGKKSEPPSVVVQPAAPVQTAPIVVADAPPEAAQANTSGRYSLARQLGLKVRRIVVDPGHGGHDPGAMHNGLREKDITLDVSLKLKQILESDYGFEVLMTRGQDRFIPLEERTAFANSNSADLFVSVHVNSSRNRKARGVETYYLNFATTPEAMEVAARENAISEKNMAELQKLTTAIALNSKIEESRDLARQIQSGILGKIQKPYSASSLGVKQAPFYVLIGAQMPSILAEISFISNEQEAGFLSSDKYKQSIAEGIAKGVDSYIRTLAENKYTRAAADDNQSR